MSQTAPPAIKAPPNQVTPPGLNFLDTNGSPRIIPEGLPALEHNLPDSSSFDVPTLQPELNLHKRTFSEESVPPLEQVYDEVESDSSEDIEFDSELSSDSDDAPPIEIGEVPELPIPGSPFQSPFQSPHQSPELLAKSSSEPLPDQDFYLDKNNSQKMEKEKVNSDPEKSDDEGESEPETNGQQNDEPSKEEEKEEPSKEEPSKEEPHSQGKNQNEQSAVNSENEKQTILRIHVSEENSENDKQTSKILETETQNDNDKDDDAKKEEEKGKEMSDEEPIPDGHDENLSDEETDVFPLTFGSVSDGEDDPLEEEKWSGVPKVEVVSLSEIDFPNRLQRSASSVEREPENILQRGSRSQSVSLRPNHPKPLSRRASFTKKSKSMATGLVGGSVRFKGLVEIALKPEIDFDEICLNDYNFDMSNTRDKIVQEILTTEITYVKGLKTLNRTYIEPLRSTSGATILSKEHCTTLFGAVVPILDMHKTFLRDFSTKLLKWPEWQEVGKMFVNYAPFFKMYSQYSQNHEKASELLTTLRDKNKKFVNYVDELQQHQIESPEFYLIMPIQRIPRYKLLLEQVIKYSEESHLDYENLKKALVMIDSSAHSVNQSINAAQKLQKVIAIQKTFVDNPKIVAPSRVFVKEGKLTVREARGEKEYSAYVFNDTLLLGQQTFSGNKVRLLAKFDRKFFVEGINSKKMKGYPAHMFIIWNTSESISCSASTREDKNNWMNLLIDTAEKCIEGQQSLSSSVRSKLKVADLNEMCYLCGSFGLVNRCRRCFHFACEECAPLVTEQKSAAISFHPTLNERMCKKCTPAKKSKLKNHGRSRSFNPTFSTRNLNSSRKNGKQSAKIRKSQTLHPSKSKTLGVRHRSPISPRRKRHADLEIELPKAGRVTDTRSYRRFVVMMHELCQKKDSKDAAEDDDISPVEKVFDHVKKKVEELKTLQEKGQPEEVKLEPKEYERMIAAIRILRTKHGDHQKKVKKKTTSRKLLEALTMQDNRTSKLNKAQDVSNSQLYQSAQGWGEMVKTQRADISKSSVNEEFDDSGPPPLESSLSDETKTSQDLGATAYFSDSDEEENDKDKFEYTRSAPARMKNPETLNAAKEAAQGAAQEAAKSENPENPSWSEVQAPSAIINIPAMPKITEETFKPPLETKSTDDVDT